MSSRSVRMKCSWAIGLLLSAATCAFAEQPPGAVHYLSPEQRTEFLRRTLEAVTGAAIEAKLGMRGPRASAMSDQETAQHALAACEARSASAVSSPDDPCAAQRNEFKRADEALAAVRADESARLKAIVLEQMQAVRAQYPSCSGVDP